MTDDALYTIDILIALCLITFILIITPEQKKNSMLNNAERVICNITGREVDINGDGYYGIRKYCEADEVQKVVGRSVTVTLTLIVLIMIVYFVPIVLIGAIISMILVIKILR